MRDEAWLIVDTETDGLYEPIHVVEIAAQRMHGWEHDGEPFSILLNHDVPIDPMAEALHGYSRQYLRDHGAKPLEAHAAFREYAKDLPMVAYNLSFDWNRALQPEYQRLGVPEAGRRGFCAMTLARRAIRESANFKLETLKGLFSLGSQASHLGRNDVVTLVNLFERVLAQRLYSAGIVGFDAVAEFSRRTPVASCQEHVCGIGDPVWYVLDVNEQPQGPFHASSIRELAKNGPMLVWRGEMPGWVMSTELPEFAPAVEGKRRRRTLKEPTQPSSSPHEPVAQIDIAVSQSTRQIDEPQPVPTPSPESRILPNPKPCPPKAQEPKAVSREWVEWINQLVALCKDVLADGVVTTAELQMLQDWLMSCPFTHLYPISTLAEVIEDIVDDGVVTDEELEFLKQVLTTVMETAEFVCSKNE